MYLLVVERKVVYSRKKNLETRRRRDSDDSSARGRKEVNIFSQEEVVENTASLSVVDLDI